MIHVWSSTLRGAVVFVATLAMSGALHAVRPPVAHAAAADEVPPATITVCRDN